MPGPLETIPIQAPFTALEPIWPAVVRIGMAEGVILTRGGIQRNDAWDAPQPILGQDGGDLGVEEYDIQAGLALDIGQKTAGL